MLEYNKTLTTVTTVYNTECGIDMSDKHRSTELQRYSVNSIGLID